MRPYQLIIVAAVLAALLFGKGIYDKVAGKRKLRARLIEQFGQMPENHYDAERYKSIGYYFEHKAHDGDVIDAITWNDLDMEMIFMTINQTCSGLGEETLYAFLHEPLYHSEAWASRAAAIDYFGGSQERRLPVQTELTHLGKMRHYSMFQFVDLLREATPHRPFFDIAMSGLLLIGIGLTIAVSPMFLTAVLILAAVNMITYFTYKNKIYFESFGYITRLARCAGALSKMQIPPMQAQLDALGEDAAILHRMGSRSWLFRQGSAAGGTLLDLLMDYVKMLFHVDLIMFDLTLSTLQSHDQELRHAMSVIGELDACIAIASYRALKQSHCIPRLTSAGGKADIHLRAEGMYHPLIEHPVPNDIDTRRSVLLTGSNASGKSTFLKTVAVNALLSQTICTALASSWQSSYFRIYSSMALKDNLMGNESYFVVEVKSLKRIFGGCDGEIPMLCFIDEVLRGTNTVERIAASSQILHRLSLANALCFAATHDIELTSILEDDFGNYHFQEEIADGQVTFDYRLHEGRAVSRNAIRLLGMIGFGDEIVAAATRSAKRFEREGRWTL